MLVKVEGVGHVVPGGGQYLPKSVIGPACNDFHHAEVMWQFFRTAGASSATAATAPAKVAAQPKSQRADHDTEQALRARVTALFAATRAGDIAKCVELSDPAAVQKNGRDKAEQFFKAVSGLVRLSRVGPDDHRIAGIAMATDGQSARVQTQIRLGGKWPPPGTEVWTLVDDIWYYRETLKSN
jgi:hypothetical protein